MGTWGAYLYKIFEHEEHVKRHSVICKVQSCYMLLIVSTQCKAVLAQAETYGNPDTMTSEFQSFQQSQNLVTR
jgi:hypothetical protein